MVFLLAERNPRRLEGLQQIIHKTARRCKVFLYSCVTLPEEVLKTLEVWKELLFKHVNSSMTANI